MENKEVVLTDFENKIKEAERKDQIIANSARYKWAVFFIRKPFIIATVLLGGIGILIIIVMLLKLAYG